MIEWKSDDETITKWSFYDDHHTWEGVITEGEDDFSWWVMVPPTGSALSLVAEGDAHDREQAERLAEVVAKVLMVARDPQNVGIAVEAVTALAVATPMVDDGIEK